jgi:hypothetical protein
MPNMAGRELEAVARAVERYQQGATLRAAATAENIDVSTLCRGLVRRGIERRGPPRGADHHAYIDGRTAARRPDQTHD